MTESRSVFAKTWGWSGHELQIGIRELSGGGGWKCSIQAVLGVCAFSDYHLAKKHQTPLASLVAQW